MSAYAGARLVPFWLDRSDAPAPAPPLTGDATCDLAIVGGGFTGLWAAILAKQDDPGRDVVLVEGDTVAFGGSGRNGGFVDASLTHGLPNGLARFPDEIDELERLGLENLAGIEETMERFSIDAAYEKTGFLVAAREPHEAEGLSELTELLRERGIDAEYLDQAAVRRELDSPTYIAGMWQRTGNAIIDPARLAWGLARAASELGVRIHEHSRVTSLADTPGGVELTVGEARLRARRVVLATNGFPPLLRAIRRYVVPVYDYVLVTEPLSAEQRAAIGWANRQGTGDCTNQFHYYRLTEDDRILWGGYDAIYHYGNAVAPRLEDRDATYSLLSEHFFQTFPQLEGLTLHAPLGRGDRHVQPVLCDVGDCPVRQGGLRGRLHRPGRGVHAVRRAGRARPGRRAGHRADAPAVRPLQAAALPARAAALGRHPAHPPSARPGRPQPRPPRPLAALARPRRAGVSILGSDPLCCEGNKGV